MCVCVCVCVCVSVCVCVISNSKHYALLSKEAENNSTIIKFRVSFKVSLLV